MHTQTHILANLALLDRGASPRGSAVALGAVVPDLPIFVFYGYQKLYVGRAERAIWEEIYFEPFWQSFVDAFNSIPLVALMLAVAWAAGRRWVFWCAASIGLHLLLDLPVHTADAHAHFWPLTGWKFHSPVSYWDPAAYGHVVAGVEAAFVAAAGWLLFRRYTSRWARAGVACLVAAHVGVIGFALVMWT